MRVCRWLVALGVVFATPSAHACPTCVGPRLEAARENGVFDLRVASTIGSDQVGGLSRVEWRNELSFAWLYATGRVDATMPLLTRWIGSERAVSSLGDASLRWAQSIVRWVRPRSSDDLALLVGAAFPTGDVLTVHDIEAWRLNAGTGAIAPSVGVSFRHSDQRWALFASALGSLPARVIGNIDAGPTFEAAVGGELAPGEIVRFGASLDGKRLWPVHYQGQSAPDSDMTMLFLGLDARARWDTMWFGVDLMLPLWCASPGGSQHGTVVRLSWVWSFW